MTRAHRVAIEPSQGTATDTAASTSASTRDDERLSRAGMLRTYRRYAPVYDWIFGRILDQGRRELGARVRAIAPQRLLEVGVGTGLMLRHYPAATDFTGIDLSEQMLAHAHRRASSMQDRQIALECMDAEHMRFEDGTFDCVTLPYVLSVTPDPDALVTEVRRVCRHDGHIVLLNHFSGGRWFRWSERLMKAFAEHLGFRSEFDFAHYVGKYDWAIESVHSTNLLGLSRVVVLRNTA